MATIEAEITSVRHELQRYRRAFGPIDGIETVKRYADLGEFTAAALGSNTEWPGAEPLEWIDEHWGKLSPIGIGDQTPEDLVHWRAIADRLGIEHNGEPVEVCSVDECSGLVPADMLTTVCPQHEEDEAPDVATIPGYATTTT
ncbi:hypothetical protein [Plantibacter flavus]|uniref:hypothetical protein n=1 Tax=Plantibacter flavus TaxID=150123 RepID=UPI0011CDA423|nr:hypothetical protein [Plantibacter flavus]